MINTTRLHNNRLLVSMLGAAVAAVTPAVMLLGAPAAQAQQCGSDDGISYCVGRAQLFQLSMQKWGEICIGQLSPHMNPNCPGSLTQNHSD